MSDHDIEPTKLERLISEINRTGTSSYSGALKPLSIRLPIVTYAKVVAIEILLAVKKPVKIKLSMIY